MATCGTIATATGGEPLAVLSMTQSAQQPPKPRHCGADGRTVLVLRNVKVSCFSDPDETVEIGWKIGSTISWWARSTPEFLQGFIDNLRAEGVDFEVEEIP